ncbi:hypothetical protein BDY21DRAFT_288811 [Lineolata rhizophorae]|uniref:non-specific serine/threonine protein kinase n=1 Tax=Lineolata rhizophorae TaxID=578093 RepID=A0A6A6NWA2_9PEZI|nr:hypothetical protein BDY21DRAFT_288811 [Lineolata rhizophorae]
MSSRYPSTAAAGLAHRAAAAASSYPPAVPPAGGSAAPPGTFAPGTKVQVGSHRVMIEKYLSEGGFAHVYVVRYPRDGGGGDGGGGGSGGRTEVAVLKRVAVPDKEALANMRNEVETMKRLKGHRHIVTYLDSHASQLKGGGYEVFLLMEYCAGGGLIDFMNTRLQHRLTEPEILHIFADVAEGVACMHYLKPPLLHRDLKVENVLISTAGSARIYKLCDFGSAAPPRPAASTAAEGKLIEDDVQRHTTMQYRSPEMIDVYRGQPIDEKSDIWALGVLLYKLCYYTTPFEDQGQMAILNASFKYPPYPAFSNRIKKLIGWMLRESPQDRPNIYQVVREVCMMRGKDVPIKDIYAGRTRSEARRNEQLPSPPESTVTSPPMIGLHHVPPVQQVQVMPDVTPMRRGRPTAPSQRQPVPKPSPSPMRTTTGDPFAALDSPNQSTRAAAADELSSRFPSLDEFSLLHDRGQKFEFTPSPAGDVDENLKKRVTEALADDAFAQPAPKPKPPVSSSQPASTEISRVSSNKIKAPEPVQPQTSTKSQPSIIHQPTPQHPVMVSTGTGASPPTSPDPSHKVPDYNSRPIYRFPPPDAPSKGPRKSSQTRAPGADDPRTSSSSLPKSYSPALKPEGFVGSRPAMLDLHRSQSATNTLNIPKSPASSRPSLEGSRPSTLDLTDPIGRSKSANSSRPRPSSVHVESNLDYLRDREAASASRSRPSGSVLSHLDSRPGSDHRKSTDSFNEEKNIESNVDFLRAMEGDDTGKRKDKRSNSGGSRHGHSKRTSMPSISLSGTKGIIRGKFGDAFRRFEANANNDVNGSPEPSPLIDVSGSRDHDRNTLTPIAGSEATGDLSDDDFAIHEAEGLPPEMRRELERRRLSEEEKRVADAAAEYRRRVAEQGAGRSAAGPAPMGPSKASMVQNRVKQLLEDSEEKQPTRTAEGYGRYTDVPTKPLQHQLSSSQERPPAALPARKPTVGRAPGAPVPGPSHSIPSAELAYPPNKLRKPPASAMPPPASSSAPPAAQQAPSKPPPPPPRPALASTQKGPSVPLPQAPSQLAQTESPAGLPDANGDADDWEANFAKRYPSLSGLEMVEAEIRPVAGAGGGGRGGGG